MAGITIKEFIEELQHFAYTYGDDTEVVVLDADDGPSSPTVSGGPNKEGIVRICIA